MGGGAVRETYLGGAIEDIRNYCEADTVNTYLLYLRFQLMRCSYSPSATNPSRARAQHAGEAPRAALAGVSLALEVKLRIDSLDAEGRGVARNAEGKVTFVEGALPGEESISRSCARNPRSRSAA